jgi:hypothetical protein
MSSSRTRYELIGASTEEPSSDGAPSTVPRLNPWFVEWMLGAPQGWSDPDCPLSATEFKSRWLHRRPLHRRTRARANDRRRRKQHEHLRPVSWPGIRETNPGLRRPNVPLLRRHRSQGPEVLARLEDRQRPPLRCVVQGLRQPRRKFAPHVSQSRLKRYLPADEAREAQADIRNTTPLCFDCHEKVESGTPRACPA